MEGVAVPLWSLGLARWDLDFQNVQSVHALKMEGAAVPFGLVGQL